MAENTIEVAITAESINNQKRAVQVLKDAFKKQLAKDVAKDESAVYALMIPLVFDMKGDINAAKDSLESYEKVTIEDYENIIQPDLDSYEDLNNMSGNYSLTPDEVKEIKDEVNKLMGKSAQDITAIDSTEVTGRRFNLSTNGSNGTSQDAPPNNEFPENITEIGEGLDLNYTQPPSPPESVFSSSYKNKKKSWGQQCIPCFPRPDVGNLRPGDEIYAMLESQFANRFEALTARFKRLFSDPAIYDDLCEIGNFLNSNCVPDLRALVALLSLYSAKIADVSFISPQNMFMSLIGPIFSPVFQGLQDLLDKYIQLIISPVECVLRSIDTQIAKLDVLTPLTQAQTASLTTLERRINSLRRKKERLIEQKQLLEENGGSAREISTVTNDLERTKEQIPRAEAERDKLRARRDLVQSKNFFGDFRKGEQAYSPANIRKEIGDGLKSIRSYSQKGIGVVNSSLEKIKKEIERLIFGRASSAEDMLQGAEDLQKLARILSLVNGFMQFSARFLEGDLCKEPGNALNNLIIGSGPADYGTGDGSGPTMKFIKTTGENGEPLLLVTSSENMVELEGSDQTREPIEGNGVIEIDSIAGKNIVATSEFGEPAIVASMPYNLCGKKEGTSASSLAKIKEWAEASNL